MIRPGQDANMAICLSPYITTRRGILERMTNDAYVGLCTTLRIIPLNRIHALTGEAVHREQDGIP